MCFACIISFNTTKSPVKRYHIPMVHFADEEMEHERGREFPRATQRGGAGGVQFCLPLPLLCP